MKAISNSSQVCPEETAVVRDWFSLLTAPSNQAAAAEENPKQDRHSRDVPFSFMCGSRSSRDWIKPETAERETDEDRDGRRLHRLRWRDPRSGLRCTMELTEFLDFPAMDWVIRLRNDGAAETEPITDFKALDMFWKCAREGEMPELRRALGSDGRHDDFQYQCEDLRQSMWDKGRTLRMDTAANAAFRKARNGSPSSLLDDSRPSATWLPFFNLRTGDDGLFCALGWSGRWFAEFAHAGSGKTGITGGMEHLELRLRPGEDIRSPRIALLYWRGTPTHAHNVWRQFVLRHYRPNVNGKPAQMPICNNSWGGTPTAEHLDVIERIRREGLAFDYYWMDAGWYGSSTKPCPSVFEGDWGITGDWSINRTYHPEGLSPVSAAAGKADMKFLLWFEPERARFDTPVTREHPEWFLRRSKEAPKTGDNLLLNLGDPAARQWAVETVSTLIEENGIDCYREDFNFDPGQYWSHADEPGRKGLAEIRFVEGLYAFWDELRQRHPGLLIDNCASGGRRLELETISRSVALWRTDYDCFPSSTAEASQLHGIGLNLWLPLNSIRPLAKPGDTYHCRSGYSSGIVLAVKKLGLSDCTQPDFPWEWYRRRLAEMKRLQPLFLGDFYPLTPGIFDPTAWLAYQLFLPAEQEGAVVAFRRPESPVTAIIVLLEGLDPSGMYVFECADSGKTWQASGRELTSSGVTVAMDAPRGSRLFFFKRA